MNTKAYGAELQTQLPPEPIRRPVVYLVRAGEDGPIKIGCTKHLPSRLSALQTACPYPLTVLATVSHPRPAVLEGELHLRFATLRLHGEWFRAEPELLAYIQALKQPPSKSAKQAQDMLALKAECEDVLRAARRHFRAGTINDRVFPKGWQRVLPMKLWHTVPDEAA